MTYHDNERQIRGRLVMMACYNSADDLPGWYAKISQINCHDGAKISHIKIVMMVRDNFADCHVYIGSMACRIAL